MKLIFLGSGSAFTVGSNNFHSNMLLLDETTQTRLLIDCGTDVRLSLFAQGLTHRDISDVYVSHLHADHCGGLEWLAFTSMFDSIAPTKPKLHIAETLVDRLWQNVLSGGLGSLQEVVADLSTYFDVMPIPEKGYFHWHNIKLYIHQTTHIFNGMKKVPSYGLMFTINEIVTLITTDTQFSPDESMELYRQANFIFHDCETMKGHSGVHAHYDELVTLDPEIKAKMWLYHYNPGELPDAVEDGFRGFVQPGQIFDYSDITTF